MQLENRIYRAKTLLGMAKKALEQNKEAKCSIFLFVVETIIDDNCFCRKVI